MSAVIYQPSRSATTSGRAGTRHWILEFPHRWPKGTDPLTGWTSSDDTRSQVRMYFDTLEAAKFYARSNGITATVLRTGKRKLNIRPGGYGDNFSHKRREAWTH